MYKITKEQFLKVYNKYPENRFVKWVYTYYSLNLLNKPVPIGSWIAVAGFSIATIGMIIFDQVGNHKLASLFTLLYIPFFSFIITLPAFLMNNHRLRKIINELGITVREYNQLVDLYSEN